ncbi:MAG TPA: PRC-barrel domain-containing protein [Aestuariivirga sp.]|jgi:sporulation protein YlmC with PRC-barrel domain|nr:PRC-barrel domain-containing protein [Aestuariivirga sp.]
MTALKYTAATLALLLAPALGYAEDATKTQPQTDAQKAIECPAAGTVPEAELSEACKQQLGATTTQTPLPDTNSATSTTIEKTVAPDAKKTGETAATAPAPAANDTMATGSTAAAAADPNSVLASQFMGQSVYSTTDENVGEINDLVMNKELNNIVAIVGVGGFLGIGEKDVAIPVEQITVTKDANNALRLTISASKEQLEAAPAFERTVLN